MVLSKDALLAVQDCLTKEVEVPEWGGSVKLRQLSALDSDEYVKRLTAKKENVTTAYQSCELLSLAIVDEEGNRLFVTEADKQALSKKNFAVLTRLVKEVNEFSLKVEKSEEVEKK